MQNLSLILLLLLLSNFGYSQRNIKLGLVISPTTSWVLNREDLAEDRDFLSHQISMKLNTGISFEYNFSKIVGLNSSILFSSQGQNYIITDTIQEDPIINASRRLRYIRMPILLKVNCFKIADFHFHFRIGPHLDFLTTARYRLENLEVLGQGAILNLNLLDQPQQEEYYKSVVIGATLEFGTTTRINNNMGLSFLLHFSSSLSNTEGKDARLIFPLFPFSNVERSQTWNVLGGLNIGFFYIFDH